MKEAVSRIVAALIVATGLVLMAILWPGRWVRLSEMTLLDTRTGRICLLADESRTWQCFNKPGPDRPITP